MRKHVPTPNVHTTYLVLYLGKTGTYQKQRQISEKSKKVDFSNNFSTFKKQNGNFKIVKLKFTFVGLKVDKNEFF